MTFPLYTCSDDSSGDDGSEDQQGCHLGESAVSFFEETKEACLKRVSEEDLEDCIFDFLVSEDVEIAELGSQEYESI